LDEGCNLNYVSPHIIPCTSLWEVTWFARGIYGSIRLLISSVIPPKYLSQEDMGDNVRGNVTRVPAPFQNMATPRSPRQGHRKKFSEVNPSRIDLHGESFIYEKINLIFSQLFSMER
jgi:hypothetical protein